MKFLKKQRLAQKEVFNLLSQTKGFVLNQVVRRVFEHREKWPKEVCNLNLTKNNFERKCSPSTKQQQRKVQCVFGALIHSNNSVHFPLSFSLSILYVFARQIIVSAEHLFFNITLNAQQ